MTLKGLEALAQQGQESNNQGSGMFFYEHLLGKPDECTLYKHVKANGEVKVSETELNLGTEWTVTSLTGLKEKCPKSGGGCTVYSCRETNN